MKKTLLILLVLSLLYSCSNECIEFGTEAVPTFSETEIRTRSFNPEIDRLGFGYDITGIYLSPSSVRGYNILDIESFKNDFSNDFYCVPYNTSSDKSYFGETYFDYVYEVIKKTKFEGSVAAKLNIPIINLVSGMLSGGASGSIESTAKYNYTSKYSYYNAQSYKTIEKYYVDADPSILYNYLSANFSRDLGSVAAGTMSADALVEKYGTHVLLGFTKGGSCNMNFKSVIISKQEYKSVIAERQVKNSFKLFGIKFNGDYEKSTTTTESKYSKNVDWTNTVQCIGGSGSGLSYTLTENNQGSSTSINFDLNAWQSSITKGSAEIVDIDWNKTYPIYEFISDLALKKRVETAVIKHITSQKVVPPAQVIPLYVMWSDRAKNSYFTTDFEDLDLYSSRWEYRYDGVEAYLYLEQEPNTVPIYRLYNEKQDNTYLASNYSWAIKNGFVLQKKLGYVYPSSVPGTVALYDLWSGKDRNTHFTTHEWFLPQYIEWGYTNNGAICYVFPGEY